MAICKYINIGVLRVVMLSALWLVACSKESMEPEQMPVTFDIANSGEWSDLTRGTTLSKSELCKNGFGVFAYYTEDKNWSVYTPTATPNFINNSKVTSSNNGSSWAYSPKKYWPHDQNDKVSFFAYAPYIANKTIGTDTFIEFEVPENVKQQIDLCWSRSATINLNKNTSTVQFNFRHALSRIGFTAQAKANNIAPLPAGVTIMIRKITLTSASNEVKIYSAGKLNLHNTTDNPVWKDCSGSRGYMLTYENFVGENSDGFVFNKDNTSQAQQLNALDSYIMAIPQTLSSNGFNIEVEYEVELEDQDGHKYSEYINTGVGNVKITELTPGQAYTINITIDIEKATIDADLISIVEWEDAPDIMIPGLVS